ncbi:MAG TPA: hypothetical protein VE077_00460 [Candidatus Methylomirabilis sp.]|nr:hypothetical protein [Candidatus Methylomirabilis sp.]
MKKIAALALALFLSYGIALADTPKDADAKPAKPAAPAKPKAAKKAEKPEAALASEVEELRQAVQAQQEELQLLKEELAKRDRQIDEARDAAAAATARAAEANTKATEAATSTAEVKSTAAALNTTVTDIKASNEALKATVEADRAAAGQAAETPAAIHIKGITITPGGFLAAESVTRTRAAQADINTALTGIPFPGNDLSRVSESNFSGRQSRLSLLFEGKADNVKLSGYYELDWLGAGVTSNSRQSNSYVMRQRQLWGQAALSNGWTFTGGQQWSLATETRKGMDNRTEALPLTIDAQYHVGFTWERQYGFRVTKNFNDKAWFGVSVEEPQITLTNHASPTPFLVGGVGSGGGLLNFSDTTGYSNNKLPDFIVKAAFEPGWGHYEIFGIISNFRARVYPCGPAATAILLPAVCGGVGASAANAFNNSSTGGGIGVNARAPIVANKLDLGLHVLFGDGVGRYSSAQLPDVTARPNGSLALIRGGGALGTLEFHPNSKLDVYANYGVEYAYRTAYTYLTNPAAPAVPATVAVGYGSPLFNESGCEVLPPLPTGTGAFGNGNIPAGFNPSSAGGCTGDLRNIQEATLGFWHKFYQGPKGGLRWGLQYSYIFKNTWSGNNNTPTAPGVNGKAVDNMIFTSFRYYIP